MISYWAYVIFHNKNKGPWLWMPQHSARTCEEARKAINHIRTNIDDKPVATWIVRYNEDDTSNVFDLTYYVNGLGLSPYGAMERSTEYHEGLY